MQEQAVTVDRRWELLALYKRTFPRVAADLAARGASLDDVKDAFHDAIVIVYERKVAGKPAPESESAYILGITRHLWYRRCRDQRREPLSGLDPDALCDVEAFESPSSSKLTRLLETAGRRCLDLLRAFYYDRRDLADIADDFGYSGIRSATVQKYKCLEKVRDHAMERGMHYADFLE